MSMVAPSALPVSKNPVNQTKNRPNLDRVFDTTTPTPGPSRNPVPVSTPISKLLIPRAPTLSSSKHVNTRRKSDIGITGSQSDGYHPRKYRRVSEDVSSKVAVSAEPVPSQRKALVMQDSTPVVRSRKNKQPSSTPASAASSSSKKLDDYSAFKGRGRYAKNAAAYVCTHGFLIRH